MAARRPGIATLEIVLVFPFLLALVAGIFLVARADTAKALTATRARDEAWKKRPQAAAGDPLRVRNDPARSEVSASPTRDVAPGPLFRGSQFRATTSATVTAHTWDARAVPFAPGRGWLVPHTDEFRLVARNAGPLAAGTVALQTFSVTFGWPAELLGPPLDLTNIPVRIAGFALHLARAPFFGAEIVLTIEIIRQTLTEIGWSWLLGESDYLKTLKRTKRTVQIGQDVFENLYDASRGRPGEWRAGDYSFVLWFFRFGL